MKRFLTIILFLALTAEDSYCFEGHWSTPWSMFFKMLYTPAGGPWVIDGIFFVMILMGMGKKAAKLGRATPLNKALWLSIACVFIWIGYGLATNGTSVNLRVQMHIWLMTLTTTFLIMQVYRTPQDYFALGKMIAYAAIFRFVMIFLFYVFFIRRQWITVGTVLDHGDSETLVAGLFVVIAWAFHTKNKKMTRNALLMTGIMLWSIQTNNRRLAWIGLIGSLVILYAALSAGVQTRRRLHRTIQILVPIMCLYVAVGWGSEARIFKPLQAFQSMGPESNDPSTESRNLENLGLVNTVRAEPIKGLGFGKEYYELSDVLAPRDVFPMYRFVPHNSVVGLLAFMGAVGFTGVWMVFPVGAYLAARAYRAGKTPLEKTIAVSSLAGIFIHMNQMYGDIGINCPQGMILAPIALGAASRMAVWSGGWIEKGQIPGSVLVARARAAAAGEQPESSETPDESPPPDRTGPHGSHPSHARS